MRPLRHSRVVLALIGLLGAVLPTTTWANDPPPTTPIKHFIVMMQENHSFDNYFGLYPGANGIPQDACIPPDPDDPQSPCEKPFHLFSNVLRSPPDSRDTFDLQYRDGDMDGFIQAFLKQGRDLNSAQAVMGYYTDADVPFYWNLADQYVLFDNFFSSGKGGSVQNHLYWVAAAPGTDDEQIPVEGWGDLPTIFDRLDAAKISWKFYVEDYDTTMNFRTPAGVGRTSQIVRVPLLAFARYVDKEDYIKQHVVDLSQYYQDLRDGALPAVAYIVSAGSSEQPPSPLHPGQRLVKNLLNALMESTAWSSSAFVLTYDQSGGWYDHVEPPQVDDYGPGFRVPALLVSPYARQGRIDSTQLDFTSLLRFIEDNYKLDSLTERDQNAKSIAPAFNFTQAPRAPKIVPTARPTPPKSEPRRIAIYGAYSGALIVAGLIVAWAKLRTRRPRQRPLPPGPRLPQDDAA